MIQAFSRTNRVLNDSKPCTSSTSVSSKSKSVHVLGEKIDNLVKLAVDPRPVIDNLHRPKLASCSRA
nr:hypothetical protein [Escherichia coli]